MTREFVRPGDLESRLQSRVDAIRATQARRLQARSRTVSNHRATTDRKRAGRIVAFGAAAGLALGAASVWASHGGGPIDLTSADEVVVHQDAVFLQGGLGAGTGQFDPFLTLSTNEDTEAGYNQCDDPGCPADADFDQFFGGGRTHELLVSAVPIIHFDPDGAGPLPEGDYREFSLDANDTGSDTFMSVDDIRLFVDEEVDLDDFDPATNTFGTDTGEAASLIFDLDDDSPILVESQALEPGSGVSDITVLIPADLFPAECFYGALDCDQYLYFYTESGFLGTSLGDGNDYNVTAGFEEWRIQLLPVVNVDKTVDISLDRSFPWDVTKSANVEAIDLFAGDTAQIDWTVTATAGAPVDSNLLVSGDIVITNPTGGDGPIPDDIDATITSVSDVLTLGGVNEPVMLNCPFTVPFVLEADTSVTCTYSAAPDDTDGGTNTATVTIEINDNGDTTDYSDTETVDFANADVDEIDECVTVTDDNATPGDTGDDLVLDDELCAADSPGVYNFSTDVGPFDVTDCDSLTITNTATIVTNDTATTDTASDSVDVTCHELTVSKDAVTSFTRDYDWLIEKSRVLGLGEIDEDGLLETLTLGESQTYVVSYEITVTMTGFVDSANHVSGTITIDNPAPIIAEDVLVSDEISDFGPAEVDCDPVTAGPQDTVDVPAEGSATCTYSADLPDGTARTNTATATLFDVDYTGTADIVFDENSTLTEVDECIDVTDDNGTPADPADDTDLGTVCVGDLEADGTFVIPHTIEIGPFECGEHTFTNTASFETTDDDNDTDESGSDSFTIAIDVPCPEGCTLTQGYWKTHNDTFWGGAPTDETWALLGPSAENTVFFLSGQTYFQVMWTPSGGNAYYTLAHQYIAAQLNVLAGADDTAIATAFADATTLFTTYTPAEIKALKGNNPVRQQFIALAGTLGSFNEGLIGPGHCDEDGTSTALAVIGRPIAVMPRQAASAFA